MAHKVIGDLSVEGTLSVQGKNVGTTINGTKVDSSGNINLDFYTLDELREMISVLPVTKFVASTYTSSAFVLTISNPSTLFMAGQVLTIPSLTINLATVDPAPANKTFYVYVILNQGVASYNFTTAPLSESVNSNFGVLYVGNVTTDSTKILQYGITDRVRLDIYAPAINASGLSFPVSTGFPSSSGNITW